MTVQGDVFLRSTSFAYGQRDSENRIGPELSWEATQKRSGSAYVQPSTGDLEEMQTRLTFVVGAVHFDHQVIQLLLLQHADALAESQTLPLFHTAFRGNSVQIPHLLTV